MKTMVKLKSNLKKVFTLLTVATILISCSEEETISITASNYSTSIDENVPNGTSLGTLNATSSNSSTVTFSIASQSVLNAVAINASTGELTVNDTNAFDFETNTQISGTIDLNTNGAEDSVNFTITIVDVVAKKVLIIGAESSTAWLEDVQEKIENTNLFDTVDMHNSNGSLITTATLMEYDAVMVYTNNSPTNNTEFGDNLADYIDNGGRVVEATFGGNVAINGNYNNYKVYDTSANIRQNQGSVRTLGNILDSNHPILQGVNDFNGGTSSYYNTDITATTGATKVAEYDNGEPLIIIKNNVGPKNVPGAFLNFYPPSSDGRNDFWDVTTNGDLIMANALKWAGNK